MRKKYFVILGIVSLVLCLSCCSGKKEKAPVDILDEMTAKPKMILSADDTAAVYQLLDNYLELIKEGNLDDAVSSLRSLTNKDSLLSLTSDQKKGLRGTLTMMAGKKFRIEYLKFNKDYDNEARIKCILFENKPGENAPNEISMTLRPVRYEGTWYLTIADDATRGSEIDKR